MSEFLPNPEKHPILPPLTEADIDIIAPMIAGCPYPTMRLEVEMGRDYNASLVMQVEADLRDLSRTLTPTEQLIASLPSPYMAAPDTNELLDPSDQTDPDY